MTTRLTSPASLTSLTFLALLAACETTRIDVSDRTTMPELRAAVQFVRPDPERARRLGFGLELEGALTGAEGEFDFHLGPGDVLPFGSTSLGAGATLRGDYEYVSGTVAARVGFDVRDRTEPRERFRLRGVVGAGYHEIDLALAYQGEVDREVSSTVGPMLGLHVEAAPFPAPDLWLYGRAHAFGFFYPRLHRDGLELGAAYDVVDELRLFVGYRWIELSEDDFWHGSSDLELSIRGVVFGGEVRF